MTRGGLTEAVAKDTVLKIRFDDPAPVPPPVLQVQAISFHYPGCEDLYTDVDYGIDLDTKVALVG